MNATYQHITVETDGPITTITINRVDVLNALHAEAHVELASAFDEFEADDAQWIAIITGAGERAFCAGNDLKAHSSEGAPDLPPSGFGGLTSRFGMTKPVIAAVNGVAMGGGLEVALACDIIVAANTAVFALPEPRVGLVALAGGLYRLPRAIGLNRAMAMILTSQRVSAEQAKAYGLVHEVVAPSALMDTAKALARDIGEASPLSIRASKEAVLAGWDSDLSEIVASQAALPAMDKMMNSEDYIEGPRAFAEKRKPRWRGR